MDWLTRANGGSPTDYRSGNLENRVRSEMVKSSQSSSSFPSPKTRVVKRKERSEEVDNSGGSNNHRGRKKRKISAQIPASPNISASINQDSNTIMTPVEQLPNSLRASASTSPDSSTLMTPEETSAEWDSALTLFAQQVAPVPEDKVPSADQKNDQDDDVDSLFGDDVPQRPPTPYVDLSLLHALWSSQRELPQNTQTSGSRFAGRVCQVHEATRS